MMFKTHIVGGVLTGVGLVYLLPEQPNLASEIVIDGMIIGGAMLGSMFPDIDTPSSKLGRKVWPISWLFNKILGHRKFTHSIPFLIMLITLMVFLNDKYNDSELVTILLLYGMIGFSGGFLNHCLLDIVTKEPVPIFYPFQRKKDGYALGWVRTGGTREVIFRWVMILGSIYFMFFDKINQIIM